MQRGGRHRRAAWALTWVAAWVLATAACTAHDTTHDATNDTTNDTPGDSTGAAGHRPHEDLGRATVVRVVDGDTVVLDFGDVTESVRLIGIDTPETVRPDSPVECYGPEASAFAIALLPKGTVVQVERDLEARDDYGRLLGYVYRAADGLFVNQEMVEKGYARPFPFPPNTTHAATFVHAARRAERADFGLWSACAG